MLDSAPGQIPPSPPGFDTTVRAFGYGVVTLVATVAIALALPRAHGLSSETALAVVAASVVWGLLQVPMTFGWVRSKLVITRIFRELGPYPPGDPTDYMRRANLLRNRAGVPHWGRESSLGIVPGVLVATVAAFLLPEGPSSWLGTPSWAAVALPALWAVGSVCRHLLVDRIVRSRQFGRPRDYIVSTVLFGFPLLLVLPSTATLFLAASGAVRFLAMGVETYRSRQGRGRSLRKALQEIDRDALEQREAAVTGFLAQASPWLVQRESDVVLEELERIAVERPGRVMRILARSPRLATAEATTSVIRSWARVTDTADFDVTWDALEAMCGGSASALARLAAVLPGVPPEQIPAEFRRKAAVRVLGAIDADSDTHPFPGASAWTLLDLLAPGDTPVPPGDWWCALADLAAERGDLDTARPRFRQAVSLGCATAGFRLAHHLACAGHRALISGDPGSAVGHLTEAVGHSDSLDYRLLLLLAQNAHTGLSRNNGDVNELTVPSVLEPWSAEAWITGAYLLLLRGDSWGSLSLLRGAERRAYSASDETAEITELISAVLAKDNLRLAAAARAVVDRHGAAWADRIPLDPVSPLFRIVHDPEALSADPALPQDLLKGLDGPDDEGEDRGEGKGIDSIRTVLAHRLLGEAALAADGKRFDEAEDRLNAARALLDRTGHAERTDDANRVDQAHQTPRWLQQPTGRG